MECLAGTLGCTSTSGPPCAQCGARHPVSCLSDGSTSAPDTREVISVLVSFSTALQTPIPVSNIFFHLSLTGRACHLAGGDLPSVIYVFLVSWLGSSNVIHLGNNNQQQKLQRVSLAAQVTSSI